jgi:hypothetical protein
LASFSQNIDGFLRRVFVALVNEIFTIGEGASFQEIASSSCSS